MNEIEIPIFMHSLMNPEYEREIREEPQLEWSDERDFYWGPRASGFFASILKDISFEQESEIAILTTSNDTYVSICVSIPCFNHATISRTVTKRTKVIVLIHEFGWILDDIEKRVEEWRGKGIVIIEDCAHVMGIFVGKKIVGNYGDYTIFSLPKIIPIKSGGLLVTKKQIQLSDMDEEQRVKIEMTKQKSMHYLTRINWFNRKKYEREQVFIKSFPSQIYKPSNQGCPFYVCVICDENRMIRKKIKNVEFGATLNERKLYIPLNPLVALDKYEKLIYDINRIMKEG